MTTRRVQLLLLAVGFGLLALGTATHAQEREYVGVAADGVTTGVGIASGAAKEANKLALPLLPFRLAAIHYAGTLPEGQQRAQILDAANAVNVAAVTNNLLVLVKASAAFPLGVLVGLVTWLRGSEEREFWRLCDFHKRTHPDAVCKYTPR